MGSNNQVINGQLSRTVESKHINRLDIVGTEITTDDDDVVV
jgi:hypothetical protein